MEEDETQKEPNNIGLQQCKHCLSIYDARYGDELQGIKPNTMFKELPNSFVCPTCESPKSAFIEIFEKNLINN